MPLEFIFDRPLRPEELELIRSQIESIDKIDAVGPSNSMRSKEMPLLQCGTDATGKF
jgi:hypothetical protein